MKNLSLMKKQIIQVMILIVIAIVTLLGTGLVFSNNLSGMADAFKNESFKSVDLILNADRDIYQAQSAYSASLLEPVGTDMYKKIIEDITTNINDVKSRMGQIQELLQNEPVMQELRNETTNISIKDNLQQFFPAFDKWIASVEATRIKYEEVKDAALLRNENDKNFEMFSDARDHLNSIGETLAHYPDVIRNNYLNISQKQTIQLYIVGGLVLFAAVAFYIIVLRRMIKKLESLANKQSQLASALRQASLQLSDAGQQLSIGSNEQAASIEETSASMEETLSMVKQNVENTRQTSNISEEASSSSAKGSQKMAGLNSSMEELKRSSNEISKIIKVIDEIAFQTNILALNAAVEAARAGEAGLGFAVVAEEVRNLAQRSAQAAKDTAAIIERNIELSDKGLTVSQDVNISLDEIAGKTKNVNQLVAEIAAASEEQARGIGQVTLAISQMEKVIQQNAASAEESAATSEELLAQAEELEGAVIELKEIVNGRKNSLEEAQHNNSRIPERKVSPTKAYSPQTQYVSNKKTQLLNTGNLQTKKHVVSPSDVIPLDDNDDF